MNIFVVDEDPRVAAKSLCDKHVVKMIVESGQMLSTTHRVLDGVEWTDRGKNNRRIKGGEFQTNEKITYGRLHSLSIHAQFGLCKMPQTICGTGNMH